MAAANAERTELAKPERFARLFGADGLARMRVFFDEQGMDPERALVAYRRELFARGRRGEYFRRTFVRGGWNAGDKLRGKTCTCGVVFGPGAEYQVLSHVIKDEGAARSKHEENFAAAAAAASTRRLGNFFVANVAAPAPGPAPSPPPPPGAAAAVATAASDAGTSTAAPADDDSPTISSGHAATSAHVPNESTASRAWSKGV